MKYGEVYIITKEFEFDNAFETREAAEWYKDNKATADLQRDLDEQGIGDLREEEKILCSITTGDVEMRY